MFVPANNYEIEIRFHTSGPESTLTIRAVNLATGECKMAAHSHTDYEALREQIYPFKSQDSRGQRNNYSSPHYNQFESHDRLLDSQFWDLELSSYGEPRVFSSGESYLGLSLTGVGTVTGGLEMRLAEKLRPFQPIYENNGGLFRQGAVARNIMTKSLMTGNRYLQTLRGALYWYYLSLLRKQPSRLFSICLYRKD